MTKDCVTQFLTAANKDPLDGATFAFERFMLKSPRALAREHEIPKGEMLLRLESGQSPEVFFQNIRENTPHLLVSTDLKILEKALLEYKNHANIVSINLDACTVFSQDLLKFLSNPQNGVQNGAHNAFEIAAGYPLSPSGRWLEITEQSAIPENFTHRQLEKIKALGYELSLDDFDPRKEEEWERLGFMGAYVGIIKFPHQILNIFKTGSQSEQTEIIGYIANTKELYPNALLVMEGYKEEDEPLSATLLAAGIDIFQESSYVEMNVKPKPVHKSKASPQEPTFSIAA